MNNKKQKLSITPLGNRVLVRPLEAETTTESGIVIPETADREKPEQGEVVAIGEGEMEDGQMVTPNVNVGDKIVFSKYGYDEIKHDGEEYFIIKGSNILAILK